MFAGSFLGFSMWVLSIVFSKAFQKADEEFDYPAVFLAGIVFTGAGFFVGGAL